MKNKWLMIAMVFMVWALVASLFAGFYYLQYNDLEQKYSGTLISVNLGVDYGNGTRTYYNDTSALTGQSLFDVTKQAVTIEYQEGFVGTEISAINGVAKQADFGWTYWTWNGTSSEWAIVWEGADDYPVANGETIMWYYTNQFDPPP